MRRRTAAEEALPHAADLEAFLRRRGHGPEAEDLAQEIFVLLLRKGAAVDAREPGAFRSFLYAVAYRLGANAARRRRRRDAAPLPDAPASAAPDPEARLLSRESVRRAAAALRALPPGTRRALSLVADEGLDVREAARVLDVSEDVVRARLSRGRRRLAALLGGTP